MSYFFISCFNVNDIIRSRLSQAGDNQSSEKSSEETLEKTLAVYLPVNKWRN